MKTAVQKLIEEMQSYSYKVSKEDNLDMVAAFDYAIGIAKKYKQKEKEQIMNAFLEGKVNHSKDWAIEYYNQTYNQEETLEEWKSKFTHHCAIKTK